MEGNEVTQLINKMTGNSDLITKKYFESLAIEMRIIDSDLCDSSIDFFGIRLPMPIMMGVVGGFSKLGEDSNYKATLAAKQLDTVYWTSSHISNDELKRMIATGTKIGMVVKPYRDEEKLITKLISAQNAGCTVLASDIDHAYSKTGNYDQQGESVFGPLSTQTLRRITDSISVPFIAKGVLSVHDAVKCKDAGVSGIILSHHHNIMSSAVPPVMILPGIRKAVGNDYPVYVDCGINSGCEAFKALALGASGVLVARPYMVPLAKEGTQGVVDFINKMHGELREFMNRTGSKDVNHIDSSVIHHLSF